MYQPILDVSRKWKSDSTWPWGSSFFTYDVPDIHPRGIAHQDFLPFLTANIPLYGCAALCTSIHQPPDVRRALPFGFVSSASRNVCVQGIFEHRVSTLWGTYPGGELLGHTVNLRVPPSTAPVDLMLLPAAHKPSNFSTSSPIPVVSHSVRFGVVFLSFYGQPSRCVKSGFQLRCGSASIGMFPTPSFCKLSNTMLERRQQH